MQIHITNASTGTVHIAMPSMATARLLDRLSGEAMHVRVDTETQPAPTAAPTTPLTPPAPGEYWPGQGGHYICTQPALLGLPRRHLVLGAECKDRLTYGPDIDIPGATSQIDGRTNTAALLAAAINHPAARWASQYTADGHTDFHLPSRLDMLMVYICAPQLCGKDGYYQTSTQDSRSDAFIQGFENGSSDWYGKGDERRVVACRWIQDLTP